MPPIQALREERSSYAKEYRNILDNHQTGALSEDVQAKLDELETKISALDERINREQKLLDMTAQDIAAGALKAARKDEPSFHTCFDKWLRGGDKALNRDDWRFLNTMSTTTDSQGGYTVPEEVRATIIEELKYYSGMREGCQVISTANGVKINWPTSDGTAELGEIVAENTAATDSDPSFGTVALEVYKYSSKCVAVPFELLQDTAVDMEGFIRRRLVQRLGRIQNQHFTTGTGTSQPKGLVTSLTQTVTAGASDAITYDDLVELEAGIDIAYRRSRTCRLMLGDPSLKLLKKLKDSQGRPLWVPGVATNAPDTILGYRFVVNNDLAAVAASAVTMVFGDLSTYIIRDAMGITMYRFDDSAFTKKGQVGFLAFARSGAVLTDTSAVCGLKMGTTASTGGGVGG